MTESLKPSEEARADWNKDMELRKEEQQARIDVTVDEWMKDEGTVENALLEAVKEVSGDMSLMIAEASKESSKSGSTYYSAKDRAWVLYDKALTLLLAQIRKQMREQAEEKLYG